MGVFYVLLFVPLLIQHTAVKGISYQKKNRFAMQFFFVFLFVLIACRHRLVGNDTSNYVNVFHTLSRRSAESSMIFDTETGFVWWCRLCGMITRNEQVFFALSAAVYIYLIGRTYIRLCEDTSLTVILMCIMSVFVMLFSGIRQTMAMAVGMLSYECVRQKKPLLFLATVLLAFSLHNSAFMLLAIYPIYHAKISPKWLYVVVPVMAVIYLFAGPIFTVLMEILEQYTRFDMDSEGTGAYTMLVLFVLLAVFAYLIPDEKKLDEETIGLRNILLLSVVVQMFAPLHNLAMRMNYFYILLIPPLIPKIIRASGERTHQVAVLARYVLLGAFLAYFFLVLAPSGALNVFPYHFFWENVL